MSRPNDSTQDPGGREELVGLDPRTGETIARVPASTVEEVREAVAAARRAQPAWAALGPVGRARALRQVIHRIHERTDELVAAVSRATGKPRAEALTHDVLPTVFTLRYLGWVAPRALRPRRLGPLVGTAAGFRSRVEWRPYGVVGCLSPWNYPLFLSFNAITPALLAGNAVVLKPSELTPTVGEAIRELLEPLPPGVATVVQGGPEVGAALVDAPCDKVCLIGSGATARKVMEAAARHLTPVVFELGGQDAAIVCEDADLDVAASGVLWGAFLNAGQTCCAVERVYVAEAVADRFADLLVSKLRRLRTGPDAGGEADLGPISVRRQFEKVDALVRDAVSRGARVLAGGPPEAPGEGLWYPPTVIEGRSEEMAIFREEAFGPLLPLVRVRDEEEAVRRANEEGFNLTASVWTRDRARARRLASRLRAGAVSVNDHGAIAGTPWGMWGGVGPSGFGRLNGEVGIREFAVPVHVGESLLPRLKRLWWYPYDEPTTRALRALTDLLAAPGWAERWEAARTLIREARRALPAKL